MDFIQTQLLFCKGKDTPTYICVEIHMPTVFYKCTVCIQALGGDYMIPVYRDEISIRPARGDFTLRQRLHVEIKFSPGKAEQFSTWHLFRFVCIFFEFFFVSMFAKLKTQRFP